MQRQHMMTLGESLGCDYLGLATEAIHFEVIHARFVTARITCYWCNFIRYLVWFLLERPRTTALRFYAFGSHRG